MALPGTDSFTGTTGDQLATYSSNWSLVKGDFDIQSNALACDSGAVTSVTIAARWNADTFNGDQYSQLSVTSNSSAVYNNLGPAVRCASGAESCYSYVANGTAGNGSYLFKLVAGTETQLGSNSTTPSWPVLLLLEASGTTLTAKRDGTTDLGGPITDNSLTSGYAGIGGWMNDAGARTNTTGDSWEGGNLSTATLDQEGYRWRNDDGSESAATWAANQDTALTAAVGAKRLRVLINASGDPATAQYQLEWKKSTDSVWRKVA